tara:strand:- start:3460 stop:4281 length:822 start_codon:yes stop_codon:yes gene_type:complete
VAVDNVLKLYSKTLRSEFLHYGFWDNPDSVELSEITLKDIHNAQRRYIEHLSSFIPNDVASVLDVGCGIGGNARYLLNNGYEVETLSPDKFQNKIIKDKFKNNLKFYRTKFEDFKSEKKYDLILESESACYIDMKKGFQKASEILKPKGYILSSDYFVYYNDNSSSLHLKSSHNLKNYISHAKDHGFKIVKEYDQTLNTMPTLDYGNYLVNRFIEPLLDYLNFSAKRKYPKTISLISFLIGNKFDNKKKQLELIDSTKFKKYRKYMIYLFQKV